MPGLVERYQGWRRRRLERKLQSIALASRAQAPAANPEAQQLAQRALGGMSGVTWDDVNQRYTLLGPQTPIYSIGWQDTDLDRLLRASAWSWASINGNAKAMGQLTPTVEEKIGGKWVKAPDEHPLWSFISDPLGTDKRLPFWSWQHLFYVSSLHYYAAGNAYWIPVDSLAGLSVVPLLQPTQMTADEDDMYGAPTRYKYKRNGRDAREWAPEGVVNIQAPSASSFWKGSSPLRAALRATEIDHVATERQRYNLRNRISPGMVVSFDAPLGPTPEQRKKVKAELEDDYQDAMYDGKPLVLGGKANVEQAPSAKELEVFNTKRSAREEIIATIGTQPSIMGQLDGATYSNTKEATVLWFNGSIDPVLGIMYGHINSQLVQRKYGTSTRIYYSLVGSQIGLQVMLAKLDVAEKLKALGYTTNDINEQIELGMPERDYLDSSAPAEVVAGHGEDADDQDDEPELEPELEADAPTPIAAVD